MISDMCSAKSRDVVLQTKKGGLPPASGIEFNCRQLPFLVGIFGSVSEARSHARKSNFTVGGCSAGHMMATLVLDAERSSRKTASSADSEN